MSQADLKNKIAEEVIANQNKYYRLAFSYVKNKDDALDIVQESVCKAIASADSIKNSGQIKSWFCRIIINTSLDFISKNKKILPVEEDFLLSIDQGQADQYKDFDLQRALEELPAKERSIIILRYFEDMKLKDIAEVLDENVNTVKTKLYKILRDLKIQLGNY